MPISNKSLLKWTHLGSFSVLRVMYLHVRAERSEEKIGRRAMRRILSETAGPCNKNNDNGNEKCCVEWVSDCREKKEWASFDSERPWEANEVYVHKKEPGQVPLDAARQQFTYLRIYVHQRERERHTRAIPLLEVVCV